MTVWLDDGERAFALELYRRVKRDPREGTITDAITVHAQACGFVAWLMNVHPDAIAAALIGEGPQLYPDPLAAQRRIVTHGPGTGE